MSRYLFSLLLLGSILAGCSDAKNGSSAQSAVIQVPTEAVPAPNFERVSALRLIADGKEIRVGSSAGDVFSSVYPKPEKRGVEFRDLPPGFGPEFQSKGWETDAEGFGAISLGGQVVVAVRSELSVDENRVGEILRKYQLGLDNRFLPSFDVAKPDPSKSWARYWFAEDGQDRLMVCAVRVKSGVLNVTEAIGFNLAMNALRMGKEQAKHDLEKAGTKPSS